MTGSSVLTSLQHAVIMEQVIMEQALLQAAQKIEDQLDAEMHQMDNLGDDEVEQLRRKRMMVCNFISWPVIVAQALFML